MTIQIVPVTAANEAEWKRKCATSVNQVIQALSGYQQTTSPVALVSYTVASLPAAAGSPSLIYVSDETGGAVPAFNDGTNWRRVTDRAIVS